MAPPKTLAIVALALLLACKPPEPAEAPKPTPTADVAAVGKANTPPTSQPGSAPKAKALDLQGHRGARGLRPENTLPSLEVALDHRVDTLEFDLHFTKDGVAVVWHDALIRKSKCRVHGAPKPAVPDPDKLDRGDKRLAIAGLNWPQLAAYQCDRNPEPDRFPKQTAAPTALAGDNYRIQRLADVLAFVERYAQSPMKTVAQRRAAARVRFNVETKRKPEFPEYIGDGFDGITAGPFERAVAADVASAGVAQRFTLQSFDHRSLWAMHQLDHTISLSALTSKAPKADAFARWASRGATVWSPDHETLTPELVKAAHDAHLLVIPWTLNTPEEMARASALGVDGLISDRPDVLMQTFRAE